jgi:hypothetical protein
VSKTLHGHYVGKKASRTYTIWVNMRNRCERTYHSAYKYYGGKGIKVCERWRTFANFLADMGAAPEGLSLDRIDGSRDYENGNCRWVTHKQQMRNTSFNRLIEFNGETKSVAEWAETLGVPAGRLYARIERGLTPERALSKRDLRK